MSLIFRRFAVYDPGPAPLAGFGARWLGWDAAAGQSVPAKTPGAWTEPARRYGFHATIKAPFRLAEDVAPDALAQALQSLAATLPPVDLPDGLQLAALDGFLALIPVPQPMALTNMAAAVVRGLDDFRAPLTDADIARRRPETLTPKERANLDRWGYPHVMDDFRYHMTLTGPLSDSDLAQARAQLDAALTGLLPRPHQITELALTGEDADGFFHEISRFPLGCQAAGRSGHLFPATQHPRHRRPSRADDMLRDGDQHQPQRQPEQPVT